DGRHERVGEAGRKSCRGLRAGSGGDQRDEGYRAESGAHAATAPVPHRPAVPDALNAPELHEMAPDRATLSDGGRRVDAPGKNRTRARGLGTPRGVVPLDTATRNSWPGADLRPRHRRNGGRTRG